MNLRRTIRELEAERERLNRAITALKKLDAGRTKVLGKSPGNLQLGEEVESRKKAEVLLFPALSTRVHHSR